MAAGGTSTGAVTPTVLTGVSAEMKVYHEEIFGPVAPVTFVFAACSAERGNAYLADALAGQAVRHGADADCIKGLPVQDAVSAGLGDSVGTLVRFGRKIALEPYKSVPGDISSLQQAGWADEDLVEVLSVVSLSAYMDILSLSLRIGQQPVPRRITEPGGM